MKLKSFTLDRHSPKLVPFEKEVAEYLKKSNDIIDLEVHEVPHNNTVVFLFKEGDKRTEEHEIVIIGPDKLDTVISNMNATIAKAGEENKKAKYARLVVLTKTGRTIVVVLFKDIQLEEAQPAHKENQTEVTKEAKAEGSPASSKRGRKAKLQPAN